MANGKPEDAEKVWATIKGKDVEIPQVTIVSVSRQHHHRIRL